MKTKPTPRVRKVKGFILLRSWPGLKEHMIAAARTRGAVEDIQEEYLAHWVSGSFRSLPCTITYSLPRKERSRRKLKA